MIFRKNKKLRDAIRNKDLARVKELLAAGAKADVKMIGSPHPDPQRREIDKVLLATGLLRDKRALDRFVAEMHDLHKTINNFLRPRDEYSRSILDSDRFYHTGDPAWEKLMLDAGATPTIAALHTALENDDKELGRALIAAGLRPGEDELDYAALGLADVEWTKMLMAAGAFPSNRLGRLSTNFIMKTEGKLGGLADEYKEIIRYVGSLVRVVTATQPGLHRKDDWPSRKPVNDIRPQFNESAARKVEAATARMVEEAKKRLAGRQPQSAPSFKKPGA